MERKKIKIEIGKFYLAQTDLVYVFAHDKSDKEYPQALAVRVADMRWQSKPISPYKLSQNSFVTHPIDEDGYIEDGLIGEWPEITLPPSLQNNLQEHLQNDNFNTLRIFLQEMPKMIENLSDKVNSPQ